MSPTVGHFEETLKTCLKISVIEIFYHSVNKDSSAIMFKHHDFVNHWFTHLGFSINFFMSCHFSIKINH